MCACYDKSLTMMKHRADQDDMKKEGRALNLAAIKRWNMPVPRSMRHHQYSSSKEQAMKHGAPNPRQSARPQLTLQVALAASVIVWATGAYGAEEGASEPQSPSQPVQEVLVIG